MDEPVIVTREIELDGEPAELWPLVAEGDGWAQWLATEVDVEVAGGATGRLVDDDGLEREVRVDAVEPERSAVRFTWWPATEPGASSTVELVMLPTGTGSRLRITEIQASSGLSARACVAAPGLAPAWEFRLIALWLATAAVARARG